MLTGIDAADKLQGGAGRARGPTVADLFGRYAAEHLRRNGLRSAGNAEKQLRLHVLPAWGKRPVTAIERGDLVRLIEAVRVPRTVETREGGRVLQRTRGGPGAAAEVRKWCRAMFQFAVDAGLRADNPFADVRNRDRQRPRDRVLSMEELRAVWEAAGDLGYPWGPWYRLILLTGDRRGEWARARWDWLDADRTRLEIPASEYKTGKAQVVPAQRPGAGHPRRAPRWRRPVPVLERRRARGRCPASARPRRGWTGRSRSASAIPCRPGWCTTCAGPWRPTWSASASRRTSSRSASGTC